MTNKGAALGFGTMRLPRLDGSIDRCAFSDMIDEFLLAGYDYFDTAYVYGNGDAECALKDCLVNRYPRDQYRIADKLPAWKIENEEDPDRIFTDQLKKTGVDFFDVYLLHSIENGSIMETYEKYHCFEWGRKKREDGLIKRFGISFHGTPELLQYILESYPWIDFVQIQVNYADWDNPLIQSGTLYKMLRKREIPIVVMEPVKGGLLSRLDSETDTVLKNAHPDWSAASWAISFVRSLPGVEVILSGMSDIIQTRDNIRTFRSGQVLSETDMDILKQVTDIMFNKQQFQCTGCRYCCDGCPSEINIPEVIRILNAVNVFPTDKRPARIYRELVLHSAKAGACVSCGQCEKVCPQHLPLTSIMNLASQKLDILT